MDDAFLTVLGAVVITSVLALAVILGSSTADKNTRESCEKLGAFHSDGKVYECRIKGASK